MSTGITNAINQYPIPEAILQTWNPTPGVITAADSIRSALEKIAGGGTTITIGSPANGLSYTLGVLSLGLSSTTDTGALSTTDWNTFNGKVASVSGTAGRISSTGGTAPVLDLITTAVTPGSYTLSNLTVDAYGRITSITNGSAGTGTVSSVSVVTANGISGSVATATTTPAITLTLGAITPTSVNGITLSGGGSLANSGTSSLTGFTGSGTSSGTNTGNQTTSGTTNRISVATGSTNPVIDIDAAYVGQTSITTLGTIGTGTWNGSVVAGQYGGTGVANTGKTITLGGNLTTSGAFTTTLTVTANTNVTLPTSGTLYGTASGSITSAQLATSVSDETGSGALVFANTPTLVTPILGVATATSINGLTITSSTGTLTITNGKTLAASNTLTLTGTDGSSVAFGTGGTVAYTANNLSVFAATTSAQLAGVISDETGSNKLVFSTAPTFDSTVVVGTTGGTTGAINMKGTTSGTVTVTTAAAAGTWNMTLPTSAGTNTYVLSTDGTGVTSWVPGGGGVTVGASVFTSGTTGSVLFIGASSVVQQDNANFFWDDTNNRLGVGVTTPNDNLDVRSLNSGRQSDLTTIGVTNTGSGGLSAYLFAGNGNSAGGFSSSGIDTTSSALSIKANGTTGIVVATDGVTSFQFAIGLRLSTVSGTTTTLTRLNSIVNMTNTAARTVTLPTASACASGTVLIIKDAAGTSSTANITINRASTNTIDGQNSITITADYGVARLYTNATNWFTF